MGLLGEGITEVIAVTKDNAAPIGIIVRSGQSPKMILFKGSKTAENVEKYGWVTANFVSDPYLYPLYAFSDVAKSDLRNVFVGEMVMQLLRDADAWMAFTARIVNETKDAYFVELEPVGSEYCRDEMRPVNRGFNSVIDATVHATRYVMNHDPKLRELIEYHLGIVRKCGGPRDLEAAALIKEVCGL
ncbi:DUF447 domain-containing protein [uncultured Methanocorpusculum sp.]|nr:DUF447 domain-containing protein [uncultured Methanocorpusculum sp.]